MSQEKVLDVLRKLMAHRDSAQKIGSFEEAETFAAKLNELLLKHKLTISEVEMRKQDEDDPFGTTTYDPSDHGVQFVNKRVWWQEELASIVANAHFCKILVSRGTNRVYFVGREQDRQVTVYLHTYLVRSLGEYAHRITRRERDKARDAGDPDWRGWKASFFRGALAALRKRFREQRVQADYQATDSSSTALVRATHQLDVYFKHVYPRTKPAGPASGDQNFSQGAYEQGKDYGSSIPLRRGVGKGDQKSLKE